MRYIGWPAIERIYRDMCRSLPVAAGEPDYAKIEMILGRPKLCIGEFERYGTVYEKAGALVEGFCRWRAFPGGNKTMALLAAIVFLEANGVRLVVTPDMVGRLACVADSPVEGDSEVDGMSVFIGSWLEERCASAGAEYDEASERLVTGPASALLAGMGTEEGDARAKEEVRRWLCRSWGEDPDRSPGEVAGLLRGFVEDAGRAADPSSHPPAQEGLE